jgi:hypothetical protein
MPRIQSIPYLQQADATQWLVQGVGCGISGRWLQIDPAINVAYDEFSVDTRWAEFTGASGKKVKGNAIDRSSIIYLDSLCNRLSSIYLYI